MESNFTTEELHQLHDTDYDNTDTEFMTNTITDLSLDMIRLIAERNTMGIIMISQIDRFNDLAAIYEQKADEADDDDAREILGVLARVYREESDYLSSMLEAKEGLLSQTHEKKEQVESA